MYICNDCGSTFSVAKMFVERHGLDGPPYEHFSGCPYCGGAFEDADEVKDDEC